MQNESYKKRAGDVRRSARASLLEIRQARLARKVAIAGNGSGVFAKRDPGVLSEDASGSEADIGTVLITDPPMLDETRSATKGSEAVDEDVLDELAIKNAALAEIAEPEAHDLSSSDSEESCAPASDDMAIEKGEAHAADDVPVVSDTQHVMDQPEQPVQENPAAPEVDSVVPIATATEAAAEEGDDWRHSELAQLPGAGPGLVWMLEQCDIHTLAELADCEASALSAQLGVVGQILDVREWVAYAKQSPQQA